MLLSQIVCMSSYYTHLPFLCVDRRFPTKANTSDGEWQEMEMDEVIDWDSGCAVGGSSI
eukprot:SAG31_NODE_377_length_16533_cov_99.867957_12_plen_59_part_00